MEPFLKPFFAPRTWMPLLILGLILLGWGIETSTHYESNSTGTLSIVWLVALPLLASLLALLAYRSIRLAGWQTKVTQKAGRMEQEMEIARRIQQSLVPAQFPSMQSLDIAAIFQPSKAVGGDFYDYFPLSDGRLAIVIGDVSGKGIPAALHMAQVKGIFRSLHQLDLSITELIIKANQAISECFEKNAFLTAIYMVFDEKERTFTYYRAGHCPIMRYDAESQEVKVLDDTGLGLAIVRGENYREHVQLTKRQLLPNDVWVLYTDGLEEGICPETKEAYGFDRLKRSLQLSEKMSASGIMSTMLSDFNRHVGSNGELDDLTMIVIKCR
ncbi:MAG: PP2C family protein-serine/threonine phosphatase [Chitinophagales bacterium]|nr:PP2C family protein-serine/threonine phosphatase [Chitinophagales bacterium]